MKRTTMLLIVLLAMSCGADTVITYSYDRQHRLTQVSYSDSEKVFYSYDDANNLDLEVAITDPKHLRSFLLWLAMAERPLPMMSGLLSPWEAQLLILFEQRS